ncbi:MAG: DegT/DnrJ/EryC1/StrS family aminotransferase, partial [Muribaculaceae bacterium]|nr:DegT/DnrJ/EryC1/StrS family aminotransferase [Muribaculaceae bacterium]
CGTFGDYGIMSFNGNKMITTSGGGALICPDDEAKKKIMFYATQSREPMPYYLHKEIGYNYRMSNICAGIGRGQMTVFEEHLAHHKHLCDRYVELFADVDGIDVHTNFDERSDSNYWLNTILIDPDKTGTDYETVRLHLETCNIESRPLWKPMHTQPVFSGAPAYVNGVSEHLFSMGLCLPSGPWVSDEDVERVAREIISCCKK